MRHLIVTIDTEVDYDSQWRISNPTAFSSVLKGIPGALTPLFERHGVIPTYLLSPEVIEEPACVRVLRELGGRAELGTHLHPEFIEPERRLFRHNMGGQQALAVQRQYPADVEAGKLEQLTARFSEAFGRQPTAFRAGRYGMSGETLRILAELGYAVDSSVTPGLTWDYDGAVVDYQDWAPGPAWIETASGRILELPISIRPAGRLASMARALPIIPRRVKATRVFERLAGYQWLRPSWNTGNDLVRFAQESPEQMLVLMLHSTEIIAGASPYAASSGDVRRIVGAMDTLFAYWKASGHGFCSMTDAANYVQETAGCRTE
jgi:hypothetical protein